jgi:hypothetical protein
MTDVEMKESEPVDTKTETKAPEEPTDRFYGEYTLNNLIVD